MKSAELSTSFGFDRAGMYLFAPNGRRVCLSPVGAAVLAVYWPDKYGRVKNIALTGSESGDYAGAVLGPCAGRLKNASATADGKTLRLCPNEGENMLHGGAHGLSHRVWSLDSCGGQKDFAHARFSCALPDGLDGFPGDRSFSAEYLLARDALELRLWAVTSKPTFADMSSHIYWNLSGDFSTVHSALSQTLQISADSVLYNDALHIPFATRLVRESAFDFTSPTSLANAAKKAVGASCDSDGWQLKNARGFNNGFELKKSAAFAARLTSASKALRLTLKTDQPWLVLYSGGFLPVPGCAVALEAQQKPNGGVRALLPNQRFERFIRFEFDYPE